MKIQSKVETAVCQRLARFSQEYLGHAPESIRAHRLNGMLVVRLRGVLSVAERQMLLLPDRGKGRDLLKQMRTELVESARPILAPLIEEVTGLEVRSVHHDISTATGEEIMVFTLVEEPPLNP